MKESQRSIGPAIALMIVGAAACGKSVDRGASQAEPPADPEVVAVYTDGQVTRDDVDRAVLALPPGERPLAPDLDEIAWYEERVREIVLDRLLVAEADLLGEANDPQVAAAVEESRRQTVMDVFIERNLPKPEPVTNADVRAYYERQLDRYDRKARRLVQHLFKRRAPGADLEPLKQEADELRERVLTGESFQLLASRHSDSESRHRQGQLGWLGREDLPPQLADVIFSLPIREPSEPLATAEGVHLFYVDEAVEARRFGLEEVETLIRGQIEMERARDAIRVLAESLPMPDGSFVPSEDELAALVTGGDPGALVLRIGDYRLDVQGFTNLVNQAAQSATQPLRPDYARHLLDALVARERIHAQAMAGGLSDDPRVLAQTERRERQVLLRLQRQRSVERKLSNEPERLRTYYQNNRGRFSTPLRLSLRTLTVPIEVSSANEIMRRLEELAASPDAPTLEEIAAELGGEIADLGPRTISELSQYDGRVPALVAPLPIGGLAPPLQGTTTLVLLQVADRQEPAELPFAEVLDQVRSAYLADHGRDLYHAWKNEALSAVNLQLFPRRVAEHFGRSPASANPGQ